MADPISTLSDLMSHHGPEYRKGTGTDALPQGAASQANAAAQNVPEPPASPPLPDQQAAPPGSSASPPRQIPAPEASPPSPHTPTSDLEKYLLGPSQNPTEPLQAIPRVTTQDYGDWAMTLMRAAQSADATPALKAIAQAVYLSTEG